MDQPMDEGSTRPDARFAALVSEHQAVLRTFVRMLGIHPMWVDDVAQEVFLVAYRRHADFDDTRGPFIAWLRGIARKVVANERRREARRTRLLQRELVDLLADEVDDTAHEQLSLKEVHDALRLCLDDLPARSRE